MDRDSSDGQHSTQAVSEEFDSSSVQREVNSDETDDTGSVDEETVSSSFEVRMDHLSARVEELSAYTSSLEGIIDKYGTGTEVIDSIEAELSDLEERVDTIDAGLVSLRDSHWEELNEVRDSIDEMDDEIQSLDGTLGDLETDVGEQGATLESVQSGIEAHGNRLDRVEDDVDDLRSTLDTVKETVSTVGEDVEQMHREIEAIHEELADLKSFRKSLAEISNVE